MNKLTKEEVLHVANLARIKIDEEEIEKYQVELKQILDEVEKINQVEGYDEERLIAPWQDDTIPREDEVKEMLDAKEVLKNVPRKNGNFIEVPVVIGE
ncbi:MAG: Asp-tRNA(Asn)/Glu-tRNA(Gln) amidotransferase subunit GatC [Bacilli bacterium]|nr:Asp-tRNA(Asn)/Glu-tRNA(Gln) amidotransferase subunit GatC [Bacilli bacterium]